VFAVDSAHARVLTQQFLDKGIPTARVYSDCDGHHQDAGERREIRAAFAAGSIKVVVNVGVLTHGVDWDVRCLQIARPTKSEILHVQIIGRALRTAPGKDYALLLDHSDNHLRLGFVTDIHHEQLSDGRQATQKEAKAALPPPLTPKECVKCKVLKPPRTPKCPVCGYINQVLCTIRTAEGTLKEISEGEFEAIRKRMQQERKQTGLLDTEYPRMVYAQLRWVCRERGYKPGWSSNKHREKYGEWPPRAWNSDPLFEPTRGLMKWLNASQFRFVKGYH
jgi:superfamily II DNA or RNA helicase